MYIYRVIYNKVLKSFLVFFPDIVDRIMATPDLTVVAVPSAQAHEASRDQNGGQLATNWRTCSGYNLESLIPSSDTLSYYQLAAYNGLHLEKPKLHDLKIDYNISEDISSPALIGDYLIYEQLNNLRGITIHKAYHKPTREELVCKIIPMKRYRDILATYWRIGNHTNINEILEILIGDTKVYIFFNKHYGDLHSYVRNKRKLKESEASKLFYQIVSTVESCHQKGIVLRDLKLRKFVFKDSAKTQLKLEGLEDACILKVDNDLLDDKQGCLAYVSPEILHTRDTYSGKAADVWSLGVILYTMVIGRYPFHNEEPRVLFTKIRHLQYSIPDTVSSQGKCLIRSLLRKQPQDRLLTNDILRHPWFRSNPIPYIHKSDVKVLDHRVPNKLIDHNLDLYSNVTSCTKDEETNEKIFGDNESETKTFSSEDSIIEGNINGSNLGSNTIRSVKRKIDDYFTSMQAHNISQIEDSYNYIAVLENDDVNLIKEISDKAMEDCVKNTMAIFADYGNHYKPSDKVIQNLIENIPKFDGNEMLYQTWKNMFIELYSISPGQGNQKILEFKRYMLSRSVAPAFHFISELIKAELQKLNTEDTLMSWEDFWSKLDNRFLSPASQQIARNTLLTIQQNRYEKIINYLERCDATLKIAYNKEELSSPLIESQIITNICKGINDQYLKRKLFQLDLKDYKSFKEKAIELDNMNVKFNLLMNIDSRVEEPMVVENIHRRNEEIKEVVKSVLIEWKEEQNRNIAIQEATTTESINKIQRENQSLTNNMNIDRLINKDTQEERQFNRQEFTCHFCGKKGHFIRDCYLRKREQGKAQQTFQPLFYRGRPVTRGRQNYGFERIASPNRRFNRVFNDRR